MAAWEAPGFVALVVGPDGKTIKEFNEDGKRTVRIPFGTEYKLRFKNNTSARAYVRVEIDGMDALSGKKLIMDRNCTKDLERFLEGDNMKGRKFQFVTADSSGVTDPTAGENGLVRVIFEPEAISTTTFTAHTTGTLSGGFVTSAYNPINSAPILRHAGMWDSSAPMGGSYMCNAPVGGAMSVGPTLTTNSASVSSSGSFMNLSLPAPAPTLPKDLGATAAGSASAQQFQDSSEFFYTLAPVTLDIWVKGLKVEQPKPYKLDVVSNPFPVLNGMPLPGCSVSYTSEAVHISIPSPCVNYGR